MAKSCWHFTCWKTKNIKKNIKQQTYCEREKLLWIAIRIAHTHTHTHEYEQIQMARKVHVRRKWRVGDLRQQAPMGSVTGLIGRIISLRIASE